ncbi:MAG: cytochrome C [Caldimonas sp.]
MQIAPRPRIIPGIAARTRCAISVAASIAALSACGGSSPEEPSAAAAADPARAAAAAATGGRAQAEAAAGKADAASAARPALPNLLPSFNDSGFAATFSLAGVIDQTGPFFQSLGSNGRSCASCHVQSEGWTITPRGVQERFARTGGTDPIFRTNDGSNSPAADVSTVQSRRSAYSMLLNKGLIRVGIGIPGNAEFDLVAVDDPYGFASATELSLFRRPLPTANLKFLSTVMWDGRETFKDPASTDCVASTGNCFASIHFDLADQSNGATTGHAQAPSPIAQAQREAIVAFESDLFLAQVFDCRAGSLTTRGARGGPVELSRQSFHFGINDTLVGDYQTHAPFTPTVMTLYDAWADIASATPGANDELRNRGVTSGQRAVARGQALFNSKPIQIRGVKGLNDDLHVDTITGTCTTCHNTPNAGDHSIPMPLDLGVADAARRTPDMPLYTLRNKASGATLQTTDPGRALITGKWNDIGRFKGPVLRALATRAPYFHNGMAKDLNEAVDFYDTRFGIGLSAAEKADLVAFLRTL